MTIRENIKQILAKIDASQDLQRMEASDYLVKLSSLLGSLGEWLVVYEKNYIQQKINLMDEHPKMAMSKIEVLAQNCEEYTTLREAKQMEKAIMEVIRSLKYRIKVLNNEQEVAGNY